MTTKFAAGHCWVLVLSLALLGAPAQAQNPSSTSPEPRGSSPGNPASVQASPAEPGPQSTSDAPHNVPNLGLSPSQKQLVYKSIHSQGAKKSAEPVGFRSAIGSHVPDAIEVTALPKTIIELIPVLENYSYAFVANQVLIVDPQSKMVIEVISE